MYDRDEQIGEMRYKVVEEDSIHFLGHCKQ